MIDLLLPHPNTGAEVADEEFEWTPPVFTASPDHVPHEFEWIRALTGGRPGRYELPSFRRDLSVNMGTDGRVLMMVAWVSDDCVTYCTWWSDRAYRRYYEKVSTSNAA